MVRKIAKQNGEMETLAQNIIQLRRDEVKTQLEQFERLKGESKTINQKMLARYRKDDETLLHLITKYSECHDLVEKIVFLCPRLLTQARTGDYKGQTALHIAVSKQNSEAVEAMLKNEDTRTQLLRICATGSRFRYTVMLGELPLSVAALTFKKEIVDLLLENDAEISLRNSYGDTVFHSLVKYSAYHPNQQKNVITMMKILNKCLATRKRDKIGSLEEIDEESDPTAVWFYPNYAKRTPLILASELGQEQIFDFILNLDDVYCRVHKHDGLFDIKRYDITEIDTVSMLFWLQNNYEETKSSKSITEDMHVASRAEKVDGNETRYNKLKVTEIKGALERISELDTKNAFEFVRLPVIREVISKKWSQYKLYYYLWGFFHLIYITGITSYAILRTRQHTYSTSGNNQTSSQTEKNVVTAIGSLNFVIPILYLLMEGKCLYEGKYWNRTTIHHNGIYRLLLVLFSVTTFVDTLWYFIQPGSAYVIIFSVLIGWWFLTFFLRCFKKFSFFTVMIQKVLFSDVIRFSVIILIEFFSFATMIYMLFVPTNIKCDSSVGSNSSIDCTNSENFRNFEKTVLTLFNIMLGFSEVTLLDEASVPRLARILVILFILLTYVLMFNALIAMMSQTCELFSQDKVTQWKMQRLSVILFIESILPRRMKKCTGDEEEVKHFDIKQKTMIAENRYFLELDSLQMGYNKIYNMVDRERHEKGDRKKKNSKTNVQKVEQSPKEDINWEVSIISNN